MNHPKDLRIEDYNYELNNERIAKFPLQQRDESKLLIYEQGSISEDVYKNISDHLKPMSFLVFNDTKVIPARILFKNSKNIEIEIFCLEPVDTTDISVAMQQKSTAVWKCFIGNAKRWKEEPIQKLIIINGKNILLTAKKKERIADHFILEFEWADEVISFAEVLEAAGVIPLPPYLNREAEDADKINYQTIYAHHKGSVAAPQQAYILQNKFLKALKKKTFNMIM